MIQEQTAANRIIETVSRSPGCLIEELALDCPDLTWNQIFLTVDRFSRAGQLRLAKKGPGVYAVRLQDQDR
jgi:hypothetical protein